MNRIALTLFVIVLSAIALAKSPAEAAFDKLKKLEGTWEGKGSMHGQEVPAKVVYRLTGGGSALIETQFPGTAHEMMTIYHLDGERLLLTHYCAARNQPRLKLVPGKDENVLAFDFESGTNMKPTDFHMHSMKMKLVDVDRLECEWTSFSEGKPAGAAVFNLRRAK